MWQYVVFIVPIIESEMWVNLVWYFVPDSRGCFMGYFMPMLDVYSWHE